MTAVPMIVISEPDGTAIGVFGLVSHGLPCLLVDDARYRRRRSGDPLRVRAGSLLATSSTRSTGNTRGNLLGVRPGYRTRAVLRVEDQTPWVVCIVDVDAHAMTAEQFELTQVGVDGASGDVPDDNVVWSGVMHRCGQVVSPAGPGHHDMLRAGASTESAHGFADPGADQQATAQPAAAATGVRALRVCGARHQAPPPRVSDSTNTKRTPWSWWPRR
jgi:hypothetical protein